MKVLYDKSEFEAEMMSTNRLLSIILNYFKLTPLC